MVRLLIYALVAALFGGACIYVLAGNLPEGAIAGMVFGGSIGVLVAMRKGAGDSTPSFEYEAAGIHDDNLITTARRNLVREAYRDSYHIDDRVGADRRNDQESSASTGKR